MNHMTSTCNDWTNSERNGRPWCGHSWPRQGSGVNWMSALAEGGCAPGVNLREMGGPERTHRRLGRWLRRHLLFRADP